MPTQKIDQFIDRCVGVLDVDIGLLWSYLLCPLTPPPSSPLPSPLGGKGSTVDWPKSPWHRRNQRKTVFWLQHTVESSGLGWRA